MPRSVDLSISARIIWDNSNFVCFFLGNSPASEFYLPPFLNTVCSIFIPTRLWRWNRQSVQKRWHMNLICGELPRIKRSTFRTRRNFKIKNSNFVLSLHLKPILSDRCPFAGHIIYSNINIFNSDCSPSLICFAIFINKIPSVRFLDVHLDLVCVLLIVWIHLFCNT
jgi:hypothetical protein